MTHMKHIPYEVSNEIIFVGGMELSQLSKVLINKEVKYKTLTDVHLKNVSINERYEFIETMRSETDKLLIVITTDPFIILGASKDAQVYKTWVDEDNERCISNRIDLSELTTLNDIVTRLFKLSIFSKHH